MLLGRDEVLARLAAADRLDDADGGPGGEVYLEAVREVVPHAEALGDPEVLFRTKVTFAWALRGKPLNGEPLAFFSEALPVLHECLRMWHAEPHLYPEDLVHWMWCQLFLVVDAYVWLYPEPAQRIHRLLDDLERHCPPTRTGTRYAIDHYRMTVEARRGDLEAVERIWRGLRWRAGAETHFVMPGVVCHEALMWRRLGRADRAVEVLAPLMAGHVGASEDSEVGDDLIMSYLCTGRLEEAVAAHQRTYTRPGKKLEDIAAHLEFCARTGNEERGLDVLHRHLFKAAGEVTSVEGMWTAAAAALLCRRVLEKDMDREWFWPCDCDDPGCDAFTVWSYSALFSDLRWQVVNFALKLDELNGTTFQSEKVTEFLHAGPIAEHLPLPPGTAEPRHRAAPGPAPHLSTATRDDLRAGLRDALALERERDISVRLQRLLQNAVAMDEPEAALEIRLAFLSALASWKSGRVRLFTMLAELARLHSAHPSLMTTDQLDRMWDAVPIALDRVLTYPTVHAAQIQGLLRMLEPHCRPGTEDLHHLRWFRVELESCRGDVDAAKAAWAAFSELPSIPIYETRSNILRRTRWWLRLGLDEQAMESMAPLLDESRPGVEEREDYLLLPYLRTGRLDRAHAVHERTYRTAQDPPEVAAHLEFCTRTGLLEHGREIIQRNLDLYHMYYDDTECSFDRVRAYGPLVRLSESIVADGLDHPWTWPAHECCPASEGWSYARLAKECRPEGALFAARWAELMGTIGRPMPG
ncbi:hypothetical protein Acsp03_36900 [Actinomadura sp. NBRC 104412]|uniref:hypothetical protein n=1 Tax=Actinomadura sp. NBRC 104412 TaxID=3032203 RepID=UPI0024A5A98C|nr:hypothetical protein [Actinomadura sp. NBRC 104412]GLZ06224.1 hypothetical protein Acsp03_36900 [Actinomadura sp. NBRC 104412]